jgi:hypothetical protein
MPRSKYGSSKLTVYCDVFTAQLGLSWSKATEVEDHTQKKDSASLADGLVAQSKQYTRR